jgi:hypothetical protein
MKVKNYLDQEQYEEFLHELDYLEWLRESYEEPSEDELNTMEAEYNFRLTKENIYLYLHSVNNQEYNKANNDKGA